jgi:hypothetical protein
MAQSKKALQRDKIAASHLFLAQKLRYFNFASEQRR